MSYTGVCRFCGQINISGKEFLTQEAADKYASEKCGCIRATNERNRIRRISEVKVAIDDMFGEEENASDSIHTLYAVGEAVCNGYMSSVKVTLTGMGTVSISVNSKGRIKVSRSTTHKNELEV